MIRPGGEVARLVAELRGGDAIRRAAAIARLRVVGARATEALTAIAHGDEPADTRAAALKALAGIDDPRVVEAALPLLDQTDPRVALGAVDALRQWVVREDGARVLDSLTTVALDTGRDATLRLAALDAIRGLPRDIVAPLLERAALGSSGSINGDDPLACQEWLAANHGAPLSEIHAVIVRLREHERNETAATKRDQWLRARGAAHAALAARGSRVALYDLRETFDAAHGPLPLDYLATVTAIGDGSCLEPMARAWAAAPGEDWWRERLADAAADIMRRARLSGRSGLVKRIRAKWPGFV